MKSLWRTIFRETPELRPLHVVWLAMAAMLGAATPAVAEPAAAPTPAASDRWSVTVAPYLWVTSGR